MKDANPANFLLWSRTLLIATDAFGITESK